MNCASSNRANVARDVFNELVKEDGGVFERALLALIKLAKHMRKVETDLARIKHELVMRDRGE